MLPRLLRLSLLCGWALLVACRSNSRRDLLEAELRTRDRQLRELQEELQRSRGIPLESYPVLPLTTEAGSPQDSPGKPTSRAPATTGSTLPARTLELATGTGTADEDRVPGDEILILIIVPRDEDGSPCKAVGGLSVQVQEISREGTKNPLHSWDLTATQLRPLWSQGLFSTGYRVKLAMVQPPRTEKLRVTVQLTLPDGRVLEADRDLGTHPAPAFPTVVPPGPVEGPSLSKKAHLLPPRPANRPE